MTSSELHQKAIQNKYYKLFLPERLGGRNESLGNGADIIRHAAKESSDLGWMISIGTGGNYFAGYMNPKTAASIFLPKGALIAGSGAASGVAEKNEHGWLVTGSWNFCSGAENATYFTFSCKEKGSDNLFAVAIPKSQVTIAKNWDAFGLKETQTHTAKVDGVFVPNEFAFSMYAENEFSHPLYAYPFSPFAVVCFISVVQGIHEQMVGLASQLFERQIVGTSNDKTQRSMAALGEITLENEQRWDNVMEEIHASWKRHLQAPITGEECQKVVSACTAHNRICKQEALDIFSMSGMSALSPKSTINRCFRDLLTASQHSLLNN